MKLAKLGRPTTFHPMLRPVLASLLLISLLALAAHLAPAQTDTASAREPAAPPQQGNDNDNNDPPGGGNSGDPGESGGAGAASAGAQSDNGGATASSAATQGDYSAFANASQTTYPPGLGECSDLALEMYLAGGSDPRVYYRVGNLADETIANVRVEFKVATPQNDDFSGTHYIDDGGVKYQNYPTSVARVDSDGDGRVELNTPSTGDRNGWVARWEMPTIRPAVSHSVSATIGTTNNILRMRRIDATMAQLAPDGTAFYKTERVYWTRSVSTYVRIWNPSYGVALSADERRAEAGDTVNFKVKVNAYRAAGVNARVEHTPGLTLASTPSTPASTTWTYSAAKRQGDFWIGTESVLILSNVPTPNYEITLPMWVKSGATPSEQCVTVTATGVPGVVPRVFSQTGDDPSDNTETLCLGRPPLFDEDGDEVALWTVYPCVGSGTKAHPCDSTDTLEVASVDSATGFILSAAPDEVNSVIKLDPVAGAIVDAHTSNVHRRYINSSWVNNTSTVSWVTKRTCPTDNHGHDQCGSNHKKVPGVAIEFSQTPFADETSDWNRMGLLVSVSGVGAGLDSLPAQYGPGQKGTTSSALPSTLLTLPTAPGGMVVRRMDNGAWRFELRTADSNRLRSTYPRHKRYNWNFSQTLDWFAEFGQLGTYVMDFHMSANRASAATYKPG